jgi:hypothetical protein
MKVVLALAIGRRQRFGAQLGQWRQIGACRSRRRG